MDGIGNVSRSARKKVAVEVPCRPEPHREPEQEPGRSLDRGDNTSRQAARRRSDEDRVVDPGSGAAAGRAEKRYYDVQNQEGYECKAEHRPTACADEGGFADPSRAWMTV